MEDCLFCKIKSGIIPSYTVYEDEVVKVFLDIYPETTGHMLLIPKKHILDLTEIDDETFMYFNRIIKKIDKLLKVKLGNEGLKIIQNNGICQDIKHYHIHLIPKYIENNKKYDLKEVFELLTM